MFWEGSQPNPCAPRTQVWEGGDTVRWAQAGSTSGPLLLAAPQAHGLQDTPHVPPTPQTWATSACHSISLH